jgi:hypothetical protein
MLAQTTLFDSAYCIGVDDQRTADAVAQIFTCQGAVANICCCSYENTGLHQIGKKG